MLRKDILNEQLNAAIDFKLDYCILLQLCRYDKVMHFSMALYILLRFVSNNTYNSKLCTEQHDLCDI